MAYSKLIRNYDLRCRSEYRVREWLERRMEQMRRQCTPECIKETELRRKRRRRKIEEEKRSFHWPAGREIPILPTSY